MNTVGLTSWSIHEILVNICQFELLQIAANRLFKPLMDVATDFAPEGPMHFAYHGSGIVFQCLSQQRRSGSLKSWKLLLVTHKLSFVHSLM